MASLSLRHIYKIYSGGVKAVSDFNLEIEDKEFVVFVGPSGCGKSTTLRMVAGLEEISSGELYIDGNLVNDVEPKDRDIAMVFQNYALYPHMTVYDNMAFGLKLRKMPAAEIDARVQEAANILGIVPLLTRRPKALSGGQRQRVALGRAIVREPKVFLLDEPLSNLDAKLRVQMRTEITKLHNKLATTFIYVTHDQTEAMTMGTRIVVMKDGLIQQCDTPQVLYDYPENLFVASFLGSPQMNFFNAMLVREGGVLYAKFGRNKVEIPPARARRLMEESYIGKDVIMGVRPEDIHDEEVFIAGSPNTLITAEVDVIEKLGNETILYMKVDGKEDYTLARVDARSKVDSGDTVKLAIDSKHIHFFDTETELSIMGVPRYNRIPAKLLAEKDYLTVRFGNVKADLSDDVLARLTSYKNINSDVILEIAPADLADKADYDAISAGESGCFEIEGVVEFTEKYPRYLAAYVAVPGKTGYIVSKHPVDSTLSYGDKITLQAKVSNIQLRDPRSNEKLLASKPVTHNIVNANVTVKEKSAQISFGRNKITIPTNDSINQSGTFAVNLDPRAFSISQSEIKRSPKTVIVGKIIDADNLGESTVIFARVDGVEEYITAYVTDTFNLSVGDKVKLVVNAQNVSAEEVTPLNEVIASAAAVAPAYSFKEEKKAAPAAKEAKAEAPKAAVKADEPKTEEAKAPAKKPAAKKN